MQKNGGTINKAEQGIYEIEVKDKTFDRVAIGVIGNMVESLLAVKYMKADAYADLAKSEMKFLLPFVRKNLFDDEQLYKTEKYNDDAVHTNPDQLAEAIRNGEFQLKYTTRDAESPVFYLSYDDDKPDCFAAIALIASDKALSALSNEEYYPKTAFSDVENVVDAYAMLGIDSSASNEEVIEAYIHKLKAYDVSTLSDVIDDPEIIEYCHKRQTQMTKAYHLIRESEN